MVTKKIVAGVIVLLICSTMARAGMLGWIPAGRYPPKGSCQPISFKQPAAIAVDNAGNIFVADEDGPAVVQKVTMTGNAIHTLLSRISEPIKSGHYFGVSLAVEPTGGLLLAVKQRGTVERLNADGTLTLIAGKPGDTRLVDGPKSKARLNAPNAIAIGQDGAIYLADTRTIRRINTDGSVITLAGNAHAKSPGPHKDEAPYYADGKRTRAVFLSASGIAVTEAGDIYVTDRYEGRLDRQAVVIGLIRKVTSRGVVSTIAGNTDTAGGADFDGRGAGATLADAFGIAIGPRDNIYISEPYAPSIRKIEAGYVSTVIGGELGIETSQTGLVTPTGIAVDAGGTIFVADDSAFEGDKDEPTDWLHQITAQRIRTLCSYSIATKLQP